MNLSGTIKSIQDSMRKDDGVDGDAQRIGQLTWMLFLRIFDQREEEWKKEAADHGNRYRSTIPEACRWRSWAALKNGKPQVAANKLIHYVNTEVFPTLKSLPSRNNPKATVVREVFRDANNYMKSGTQMRAVIDKLNSAVDFNDFKTRQNLGDIYEQILNDLRCAGNAGEFYTPRALTRFMVKMVNPRLEQREVVLDPACGTGGFLTAAIDWFNTQSNGQSSATGMNVVAECIRGIEKKPLPHLLCTTNLLLHGIDVPSMVSHQNTLARAWEKWRDDERVDCVITNPPFGGAEDDDVGNDYPQDVRTRETADMFLVLIVNKLLKQQGGRSAVVLPDGTLFGEGTKAKVKEMLLRECDLHTIIRLPNGVFNPYAPLKTNLLFFTKGKPTETIWFYEHRYPKGVKSYSKTKPLELRELQPISDWWGNEADGFESRVESEVAWKVNFGELRRAAVAKAQPHWDMAKSLTDQVDALTDKLKILRDSLKSETQEFVRFELEEQIRILSVRIEEMRSSAKDEKALGDRAYWPIYNLDVRNPRTLAEETHDADTLLSRYTLLLDDIRTTQHKLKIELSAALAHHFEIDNPA